LDHWFAARCAVARVACLLAGVSNAKLYRPVSPSVPSDHDECHKERERKNKYKKTGNHRSKIKLACWLAEQMKTRCVSCRGLFRGKAVIHSRR
jgi:hypothetical protein